MKKRKCKSKYLARTDIFIDFCASIKKKTISVCSLYVILLYLDTLYLYVYVISITTVLNPQSGYLKDRF